MGDQAMSWDFSLNEEGEAVDPRIEVAAKKVKKAMEYAADEFQGGVERAHKVAKMAHDKQLDYKVALAPYMGVAIALRESIKQVTEHQEKMNRQKPDQLQEIEAASIITIAEFVRKIKEGAEDIGRM